MVDTIQTIARSTMKEVKAPAPGGAALTKEQERTRAIQTKMTLNKNQTLGGLRQAIDATRPVDAGAIKRATENQFGVERDNAGAKTRVEPGSGARATDMETTYRLVNDIFGDRLTGTDLATVRSTIDSALASIPGMDYLATLSSAEQDAEIDALLRNPEFKAVLRAKSEALLADSRRLEDKVTAKKSAYEQKEAARAAKEAERTDVGTRLTAAKTAESDFRTRPDAATGKTKVEELKELQIDSATGNPRDLEAEFRKASRSFNTAQVTYDAAVANFAQVRLNYPPTSSEFKNAKKLVTDSEGELNKADSAANAARKNRDRRIELEREARELPDAVTRIEAEQVRIINEYAEAERQKLIAQAEYGSAQIDRTSLEESYAQEVQNLIADSAREYISSAMIEANQVSVEQLDALAAAATTEAGAAMAKAAKERYFKTVKKGRIQINGKVLRSGKDDLGIDYDQARTDAESMMTLGGSPESIVKKMLQDKYPDIVTNPGPPQVTEPDPRRVQFESNANAMTTLEATVAQNAFVNYLQSGGSISAAQEAYITSQPWGQQLIDNALAAPTMQAREQALKAQGLLPDGGFAEIMKTKKGKITAMAILAVLAGILSPVALGATLIAEGGYVVGKSVS